jgi:GT2 family glycosyltransferase
MAKIAVVILNWNGLKFLELFLPSVIRYSEDAEVYIADNNSSDDSLSFLRKNFSGVTVISLSVNEGYSKGYNLALKQIKADFYVLLNSDVEVSQGWLHPVIRFMEGDPLIAACQPKIKSYHYREYFEYAGAGGGFIDKFGYPFCRGRIFNQIEKDQGQYNDVCEVFWATGACLFIKADIYWKMEGLDEDFFAHMEEIDLCWRIKNAGYKIYYYGLSEVYHVGGGTLDKSSPTKTYLNFRNGLSLLYKNLPDNEIFNTIFCRMYLDGLAAFKFLFFDSFGHFRAVLRAHYYFYNHLKQLRQKRNKIKLQVMKYDHAQIYGGSVVIDHFFRRKRTFSELNWGKKN